MVAVLVGGGRIRIVLGVSGQRQSGK